MLAFISCVRMASQRSARLCSASTPAAAAAAVTQEHPLPHNLRNISHNQPEKKKNPLLYLCFSSSKLICHIHASTAGEEEEEATATTTRGAFSSVRLNSSHSAIKKQQPKNNRRRGGCSNKEFSSPTGGLKREECTHRRKIKI